MPTVNVPDDSRLMKFFVRFGVPGLMLIFYISAAMYLEYSPDSTFTTVLRVENGDVRSLWDALLAAGSLFRIDLLLTTKVLSLLFSSCAILLTFLIANEILRDYLHAFCVTLCLSVESWLLQVAPSGSGTGFVLFLTLAAVFFLLRNDYLLASIFTGVASLVTWQASFLMIALLIDAGFNSVDKGRGRNVMGAMFLVFAATILPWLLYGLYTGNVHLPDELHWSDAPTVSLQMSFQVLLLSGLMFVGVVILAARHRQALRIHSSLLIWIGLASFSSRQLLLLVFPLVLAFCLLSARLVGEMFKRPVFGHWGVLIVTALIVAYSQFIVRPATTSAMDMTIAESFSMKTIGDWLHINTPEGAKVSFPSGSEGVLGYYSKRVNAVGGNVAVSAQDSLQGYRVVFDPSMHETDLMFTSNRYKVWEKK